MNRSMVTYILLFLALAIAGTYYYLNNREEPAADIALTLEPQPEVSYLFNPEDGTPTRIHIESKAGEAVELERGAGNAWALILPAKVAADQGTVEAAVSQISVIQVTNRLPELSPQDVGLDAPDYIMKLKFTSGMERIVELGVVTPTENGYYARLDGGETLIVTRYAMDALLELLNNPPYIPTEDPLLPTLEPVAP